MSSSLTRSRLGWRSRPSTRRTTFLYSEVELRSRQTIEDLDCNWAIFARSRVVPVAEEPRRFAGHTLRLHIAHLRARRVPIGVQVGGYAEADHRRRRDEINDH